jgi:nicotinate-nucleotide pyrophosphorylase (carboxylating)
VKTLTRDAYLPLIDLALAEDVRDGDVTSLSVIPADVIWSARMVAREDLVVAGLPVFDAVFQRLDPDVLVTHRVADGDLVSTGTSLVTLEGKARSILSGERVALNFAQRLCGVATLTHSYVDAIKGFQCQILDTRKTIPGWRRLEKYAVSCGGGQNHRIGLYDMVMIKDNHLAVLSNEENPIAAAVERARASYPSLKVEVEADTVEQAVSAAAAGADIILLDNMTIEALRRCVELIDRRSKTEASGGITLDSIQSIAATGVDFISVGALTHSAPAVDLAFDIDPTYSS